MATNVYALRDDYSANNPVSAFDLNRRARILASQLPGALLAGALSEGVFPLVLDDDARGDVAAWANASESAFRVQNAGGDFESRSGGALIRHPDGHLVFAFSDVPLSVSAPTVAAGETAFFHLALAVPENIAAAGALDSQTGAAPRLLVSEYEDEEGALLLASIDSAGTVTDRRAFVAPVALARLAMLHAAQLAQLKNRLDAITGPVSGNPTEAVTVLQFAALQNRVSDLEARLADIDGAAPKFPDETSLLAANQGALAVGLFEVNPPAMQRSAIAALGRGFGNGQNQTPNVSPNLLDPRLAPYDPETGTLAP